jgi:hypothetical protein
MCLKDTANKTVLFEKKILFGSDNISMVGFLIQPIS